MMKKLKIGLISGLVALSIVACTPTKKEDPVVSGSEVAAETPQYETEATGGAEDKVPDPDATPVEIISIYSPNTDATRLQKIIDEIDELDAQLLVNALIKVGVLDEETQVLSFEIEGDGSAEVGPGVSADDAKSDGSERIGVLDLSQVPKLDKNKEELILGAIGNTFIENFELDKLKLLVNGKNYSSTNITQGDNEYIFYHN